MSRGTKSKAVSGEKGSPPRDESGSEKMEIADCFRMLNSRFDEQEKKSDSRFEALQEDLSNTNQRLEERQLRVPQPRLADVGVQEGKSGELEGIATEAGKRIFTMPKLQHQAHQPRLAMKADVQEDNKTRESAEDFAQDGRLGDISSDRVHDPVRLTSFGDQDYTEPPALPCRDDALVNQGPEVAKPCLSPVEMRKSTSAGSLLNAGAASTIITQGTNFPPQLLPWSFRETNEEKNVCTTRQTFAKYNRSWHPKVIETKSRQSVVFDPGGLSGCLCGCPFWEGDARCIVGGLIREAFAIRYNYLCFFSFSVCTKIFPRVI